MRRVLTTLALMTLLLVIAPAKAEAVSVVPCSGSLGKTQVCQDVSQQTNNKNNIIVVIIKDAINVLSFVIGVVAVVVIIISGLRIMLGGSNPQEISNARTAILTALGGIVVVAVAQLIVLFVLDNIG